jgi:hypothetical protein
VPCETDSRGLADSSTVAVWDGEGSADDALGDDDGVAESVGVDGSAGGVELVGGSDDGSAGEDGDVEGGADGSVDGSWVGDEDGLGGSLVTGGSTSRSSAIEVAPSASGRSTNRQR